MEARQLHPGEFHVTRRQHGNVSVLALAGELDMATSPRLDEALDGVAHDGPIVLDLGELEFIDSHGLHTILARAATLDLTLARPQANVARLLTLIEGARLVPIHDTLDAALAAVDNGRDRGA